jgi:hypothetical protein
MLQSLKYILYVLCPETYPQATLQSLKYISGERVHETPVQGKGTYKYEEIIFLVAEAKS